MTDTARTLAAIQTLFANNSVGAISPQDLRDFVQSLATPIYKGGFDYPGYVHVQRDFGAENDGSDETAKYLAAIAAVKAMRVSGEWMGGTLDFGTGVLGISEQLVIDAGVDGEGPGTINLVGHGMNATRVKWLSGSVPESMIRLNYDGGQGVNYGGRWAGFSLDANGVATRGIYGLETCGMTFSQLGFRGFAEGATNDACIYGERVSAGALLDTIEMCHFGMGGNNYNKGIYLEGNVDHIIRNEFGGTLGGSIKLKDSFGSYIVQNDFEGLGLDGTYSIDIDGGVTVVVFNRHEDMDVSRSDARSLFVRSNTRSVDVLGNTYGFAGYGHTGPGDYFIEFAGNNRDCSVHDNLYYSNSSVANVKFGAGALFCQVHHERARDGASGLSVGHVEDLSSGGVKIDHVPAYEFGYKDLGIGLEAFGYGDFPLAVVGNAKLDEGGLAVGNGFVPPAGALLMGPELGSDPAAPFSNCVTIFPRDNGSGKTQICARFHTGAVQVIATEP